MHLVAHPVGGAEARAREDRLAAELLLDAQQLVVLGGALAAARRARLDLASGQTHRQVRDRGVLWTRACTTRVRLLHTATAATAAGAGGDCTGGGGNAPVSPDRWEHITPQPFCLDSLTAAIDSEIDPIWLTLSSRQLAAFSSMARLMKSGLVTVRSSPTIYAVRSSDRTSRERLDRGAQRQVRVRRAQRWALAWTSSPIIAVNFDQFSQSSWSNGSSIVTIG